MGVGVGSRGGVKDRVADSAQSVYDDAKIRAQIAQRDEAIRVIVERAGNLNPAHLKKEQRQKYDEANALVARLKAENEVDLCRVDVNAFCEYALVDDETGKNLRQAPIHRSWHDAADQYRRLIVWTFVAGGKTSQLSIARTVWELGRDPTLRFVILSNTQGIAIKIVKTIAELIKNNKRVREVFPHLIPAEEGPWTTTELKVVRNNNSKDPSVRACGLHGALTSARVDRLVVDDILDPECVDTAKNRQKVSGWFKSVAVGRLTKRAKILIVGNAFHPDDLLHELSKQRGWKWFKFPVIDAKGRIAWPEAWPLSRIEEMREDLGPAEFARQLLCKARDDDESRFKQEWINAALKKGNHLPMVYRLEDVPEEERKDWEVWTGVDLGVKKTKKADKTAIFTFAEDLRGNRRVLWIERGKWTGPEIIDRLVDTHKRYGSIIACENNACFPAGTKVLTTEGYRSIEDVRVGDLVWTHRARWMTVVECMAREFSGELAKVRARGNLPTRCTPNHAFWSKLSGRVLGPRTKDAGKHRPVGEPGWQSASLLRTGSNGDSHYLAVAKPIWPEAQPKFQVKRYSEKFEIALTERLAMLLGLYLAEGSCSRTQVAFSLNEDEHHLRRFLKEVAQEDLRTTCGATVTQSVCRFYINTAAFARVTALLGKDNYKGMPWEWMGWPLHLRLLIVRGWLMGDGNMGMNNTSTGGNSYLRGDSISRTLIEQMRFTLLEAGYRPALRRGKSGVMTIDGRTCATQPLHSLALNSDDTAKLLTPLHPVEQDHWLVNSRRPRESGSNMVHGDKEAWSKLWQVEPEKFSGQVFNLSVAEDESYTVEGLVVHNSQDYLLQFTREQSNIPVVPHTTTRAKRDPILGVEGLAIELSNGKWTIPNESNKVVPEVEEWINEMLFYSPQAHTGDILISSYFARELSRRLRGDKGVPAVSIRMMGDESPAPAQAPQPAERSELQRLFDVPPAP